MENERELHKLEMENKVRKPPVPPTPG